MSKTQTIIIAIDGPAASGKGTLSKYIASHYGLRHLDTGLTYRAVAKALLDNGEPLNDEKKAVHVAQMLDFNLMKREELVLYEIGEAASKVAVMSKVRQLLVEKQRLFSQLPPGAVLDGRDIGTVVCPQATVKLYVTASPEIRAHRRYLEILERGKQAEETQILAGIKKRDDRDMGRADSPLRPAKDAHLIDTSEMTIETAFKAAKSIIDAQIAKN